MVGSLSVSQSRICRGFHSSGCVTADNQIEKPGKGRVRNASDVTSGERDND